MRRASIEAAAALNAPKGSCALADRVVRTAEQKSREFQYTMPGQPLLDILDDHALELELIAPSHWLSWLKPGYAFQVKIDQTEKTYPARVTRLGGRVDPVSQSIKVIGEITGEAAGLMAGMSGHATVTPP
jgi:membrane fusion protein, multidrug efflux system